MCCYMCAFTHIQYGLMHQADFESRSRSLALGNRPPLAAYCATSRRILEKGQGEEAKYTVMASNQSVQSI